MEMSIKFSSTLVRPPQYCHQTQARGLPGLGLQTALFWGYLSPQCKQSVGLSGHAHSELVPPALLYLTLSPWDASIPCRDEARPLPVCLSPWPALLRSDCLSVCPPADPREDWEGCGQNLDVWAGETIHMGAGPLAVWDRARGWKEKAVSRVGSSICTARHCHVLLCTSE